MDGLVTLFADPAVWAALLTLLVMEIVLGIDNLIFISILSNKLPEGQRQKRAASASASLCSCGWRYSQQLPGWLG
jgi:predicted tellurium resistance membrane protein TerC